MDSLRPSSFSKSTEEVKELFSHRDDRASPIVSAFVVGDCDDETQTECENHLRSWQIDRGDRRASVYGACRCNGLSRLLEEITAVPRVEESRVTNVYKTLNEELGLPAEPVIPSLFIPRLASDFGCPDTIRPRARTLVERAEGAGLTGGAHSAGFAAAGLYKAGRERRLVGGWVKPWSVGRT